MAVLEEKSKGHPWEAENVHLVLVAMLKPTRIPGELIVTVCGDAQRSNRV